MAIVRHAHTDEASNNGTWRENSPRRPESRLSRKVEEYQPNMLVVFAIVALSIFQSVGSYCWEVARISLRNKLLFIDPLGADSIRFFLFISSESRRLHESIRLRHRESNDEYLYRIHRGRHVPKFTIFRHGSTVRTSISFSSAQTELNIVGLKYGSIRRIKERRRDSPGKRFRRDLFPRRERFSQGGRSRVCDAVQWPSSFNLQANWIFSEIKEHGI